jgi:uncharacterized protein
MRRTYPHVARENGYPTTMSLRQHLGSPLRAAQGEAQSFAAAARQHGVLRETAHRPWPPPDGGWVMGQSWYDLLFAHWTVPRSALERVVPPQLPLDSFDGQVWVGVTPFAVRGLRLRISPPVPALSNFLEINVRTYVKYRGKPGIYFLSLDADSRAAVFTARRSYRLPYFKSDISMDKQDGEIAYRARRTAPDGPPARFAARYRGVGEAYDAEPGTLDHWLTERYCLYTLAGARVMRGEIHHPPWPLQRAEAQIEENTMAAPEGLRLEGEPVLHLSQVQDVVLWPIREAD